MEYRPLTDKERELSLKLQELLDGATFEEALKVLDHAREMIATQREKRSNKLTFHLSSQDSP